MRDELWNRIAQSKGFTSIEEAIKKLYNEQLLSDEKIAEVLECSTPTVRALRFRFDVKGRRKEKTKLKIPKRELERLSCRELADKYKISTATAWRLKRGLLP